MGTNCSNHQSMNRASKSGPVVLANETAPRWDHLPGLTADAAIRPGSMRRTTLLGACVGVCIGMGLTTSQAYGALTVEGAPGISVIPADEVLSQYTYPSLDGELLFDDPNGSVVRLITSTDDPEISNPGDGSFHPADANAVVATLASLPTSFIAPLFVKVFVLPYPRAGMVSSSASANAIYVSPGVYPMEDGATLRALIVHELGHVIHHHFLSSDPSTWNTYIDIRDIEDDNVFHSGASHAFRPAEIFAEDFRALFGDELAASPAIENPTLVAPDQVPGLNVWFTNLAAHYTWLSSVEDEELTQDLRVYPNPVRGGSRLTMEWPGVMDLAGARGDGMQAKLYDASGRVVAEIEFRAGDSSSWTATLPAMAAGTYWLRPVESNGKAVAIRILR